MRLTDYIIDARRLWAGEEPSAQPLALIDLDAASVWPEAPVLPPCPVIGFGARGARAHPLAPLLDAVIEPPVGLERLVGEVLAHPRTAAVTVDLLRLLPALSPQQGLVAESLAYGLLQGSAEHAAWFDLREPQAHVPPGALHVERRGDRLVLTLDRPPGNAIDRALRDALHDAFAMAALDESIARVILRADGRVFSLGAELAEFGTTHDPADAHAIRRRTLPARAIAACADRLEVHVHGACVGAGLEMAAFARRLTADPGAWFQLPELAMGLLPGAGGCVSLVRRIGRSRAALMILSGRRISAPVALDWGLVDALVEDIPSDQRGTDVF